MFIINEVTRLCSLMKQNEDGHVPNEAKSPIFSHSLISISSLAKRLHSFISPLVGDFIQKTHFVLVDKSAFFVGGDGEDRTLDLMTASHARSQLRQCPATRILYHRSLPVVNSFLQPVRFFLPSSHPFSLAKLNSTPENERVDFTCS